MIMQRKHPRDLREASIMKMYFVMDKFTYLLLSDCKKAEVSFNYIDKLKNKK